MSCTPRSKGHVIRQRQCKALIGRFVLWVMVHSHLILNWYHCSVHHKRGPGDKTRSSMPLLQFCYSPISYHYIALSRKTLTKVLIDWSYHNNQTKYEVIISREQLALCEFYKIKPGGGEGKHFDNLVCVFLQQNGEKRAGLCVSRLTTPLHLPVIRTLDG